jgi:hypothetical protein
MFFIEKTCTHNCNILILFRIYHSLCSISERNALSARGVQGVRRDVAARLKRRKNLSSASNFFERRGGWQTNGKIAVPTPNTADIKIDPHRQPIVLRFCRQYLDGPHTFDAPERCCVIGTEPHGVADVGALGWRHGLDIAPARRGCSADMCGYADVRNGGRRLIAWPDGELAASRKRTAVAGTKRDGSLRGGRKVIVSISHMGIIRRIARVAKPI